MPSRKSESFNAQRFVVGAAYSRREIASLADISPLAGSREWTGIVEFSNCVLLFSTLDKSDLPPEHNYADVFIDDQFKWESQNENTQLTPKIARILKGVETLLFCRIKPKEFGKASPFVFVGTVRAVAADSDRPVKVLFDLLDYPQHPGPSLKALYSWRPSDGSRKLDSVELKTVAVVRRGQGRQADAKRRVATEMWAMERARQHYSGEGYELSDTSKMFPFDFLCKKDGSIKRVEVKGSTSPLGSVIVTVGEVCAATKDGVPTDLFVLYGVELIETELGKIQGLGGQIFIESPWNPIESRLRPLQFEYVVQLR